jgi:hypothetical protein
MNKWALGHAGFRFPFLLTTCERAAAPLARAGCISILLCKQPLSVVADGKWRQK